VEKLIIEARVNEYMMRYPNPHVPYSPSEIAADAAACREAGAAVLHFHARRSDGKPEHAYEAYADTVRGIRGASDILIHPTLGYVTLGAPAPERLAHIMRMVDDGIGPDFAPMDMGSSNVDKFDPQSGRFTTTDLVYTNDTGTLLYFAEHIKAKRLKPYLVSWNVGFTRQTEAFIRAGLIDTPAYLCLLLSDNYCLAGPPGTLKGLQSHTDFVPSDLNIQWTICNFGGNLLTLAGTIIAMGGHLSIGLGDYQYPELGLPTNADIIRRCAEMASECGREVATPAEARQILDMH
jgi:3-keto-5-aminohexanoate cleavage enzyme